MIDYLIHQLQLAITHTKQPYIHHLISKPSYFLRISSFSFNGLQQSQYILSGAQSIRPVSMLDQHLLLKAPLWYLHEKAQRHPQKLANAINWIHQPLESLPIHQIRRRWRSFIAAGASPRRIASSPRIRWQTKLSTISNAILPEWQRTRS